MNIIIDVDAVNQFKWEKLINDSPTATWFQTKEAYVFFDSLSFLEAFVVAIESEGELKGLVVGYIQKDGDKLKRYFSKRAIILGGLLLAENITEGELGALLCALKDNLKRKAIYIETRNFNDYTHWRAVFETCGFGYKPHFNFHVDTTSLETVDGKMGKSRRRDIKYTLREGAVAVEATTSDEVEAFYEILQTLYRQKVKRPLFPVEFFHQIMRLPFAHLVLVKYFDEVVGGSLCLELKGRTMYEWFVCGRDHEWHNVHPSELATYEAICLAVSQGCKCFDMMGAGEPGKAYGVRDFKAHFGGVLVEHGRFLYKCHPLIYKTGELVIKAISK